MKCVKGREVPTAEGTVKSSDRPTCWHLSDTQIKI